MPSGLYIQVLLPLRLEWEPCYYLSGNADVGQRVIVKFAGRRVVGVVSETDVTPDIDPSRIQPVLAIETGLEPISPLEIELWRFMADYYLCTIGEVYKAAYPNQKTASEEISAQRLQRKQALETRAEDIWRTRIARLQARLDAKNADLERRHNDTIRARLEAQRNDILQDLQEAEAADRPTGNLHFDRDPKMSIDTMRMMDSPQLQRPANLSTLKDLNDTYSTKQEILKGQYLYQKELLNEVILTILTQSSDRPITERADSTTVSEYLRSELDNNGVLLPFEFAITSRNGGLIYSTDGYAPERQGDIYSQVLFMSDPANKRHRLNVTFPSKNDYISSSVRFMIP